MSDQTPPNENIVEEFRSLGQNLVDTLRAAWDSSERQRLQEEIENGLNEMADTIRTEVNSFGTSEAGKQIKADVEELREKVHSGEAETQLRQEVLNALQTINTELKRAAERWQSPPASTVEVTDPPEDLEEA